MHMATAGVLERFDGSVDLRRRATRDAADLLCDRAAWSMPHDRALITAVYRDGLTAASVAAMTNRSPRTVRRQLRQLAARLLSPRFAFVLHHRDHWPATRRRVATACILHGRTMRSAARHLNVSMHVVRKEMSIIDALFETRPAARTSEAPR